MELIPAIDLLGGRVVRLHKGDYGAATEYHLDPLEQARTFARAGATRLHVVDLDGARSGLPAHAETIARILAEVRLAVQVGGGVRTRETAERWLEAGAERVVLGTAAVRDPELARGLCEAHPGRIVIALDARGEDVAIEGWQEASGRKLKELARDADAWGAAAILYTDIARDGTSEGPAVERTAALQEGLRATVIASGGVGSLAHVAAVRDAGVRAAVCGRALYEGAFSLDEALRVARGEG
jgi:phosphoribosylformimino-5-aminoimidazole carboxamide ribotide isomerase